MVCLVADHVKTDLSRVQQRMASADALLAPLFAQAVEQWKASAAPRQAQPPPPPQQQLQQQQSGGIISQVAPGRLTSCSRVELLVSDPDLMNAVSHGILCTATMNVTGSYSWP